MKILHVADLHIDHGWFDWVAGNAPAYDLLVIAGDLQNAFSNSGMQDQARAISRWLLGLTTLTAVCSGNHDYWVRDPRFTDEFAEGAWLQQLRGKRPIVGVDGDLVEFGGVRISIRGWLACLDLDQRADVLVTHAPPAGTATAVAQNGQDFGDPAVLDMLHMPRLILSGHVHSPLAYWHKWPAMETLVLNPGHDENSSEPLHWTIDTDRGIAVHSLGEVVRFPPCS